MTPNPTPLLDFVAGIATGLITYFLVTYIYSLIKKKKHGTSQETPKQTSQKLLRFTRGNKTLTPEQQQELFFLNKKNLEEIKYGLRAMKNNWKDEHL